MDKNNKDNKNNNNEDEGMARRGRRSWGRDEGRRHTGLAEDSLGKRGSGSSASSMSLEASRLAMAMALTGQHHHNSSSSSSISPRLGMDHPDLNNNNITTTTTNSAFGPKGKAPLPPAPVWGARGLAKSPAAPQQQQMPFLERDSISATPDEDLPPAEPDMPIPNRGRRPSLGQLF